MYNPKDNEYAYVGMKLPIAGVDINNTGYMLQERVKYTTQTAIQIVSVANSNLDGTTGTYYDLITAASNGTLLKRIFIKAQGDTTQGMIRIFYKSGASVWLMREIEIPAVTKSATDETFIAIINEPFYLKPTHLIRISTEKGETFIVTAEGLDMSYPA